MSKGRTKKTAGQQVDLFVAPSAGPRDWEALERIYSKSARTLKRYDQTGREIGDPCPLESPEKMPAWWQKHMKQQVPRVIAQAAASAKPAAPAPDSAPTPDPSPTDSPEPDLPDEIPPLEISDDEIGLEKTLERLSRMEVLLSRNAHKPGENKPWLDTIARMGTVAEKLRIEYERQRKLIPREDAEKIIHEFHGPIERETRQLARTMCEITGIPITPHVTEAWNKECDRLFARFQEEVLH